MCGVVGRVGYVRGSGEDRSLRNKVKGWERVHDGTGSLLWSDHKWLWKLSTAFLCK